MLKKLHFCNFVANPYLCLPLNRNSKINWDTLGIAASLACAIHCAFLPLFFTSVPIFGTDLIENIVLEIVMVILAFAIGVYSLYHGFRKHHHTLLPIVVFLIGFSFLVLKLFFVQYENWLLVPAVTGIVSAHMINFRACKMHNHAHADDCNH